MSLVFRKIEYFKAGLVEETVACHAMLHTDRSPSPDTEYHEVNKRNVAVTNSDIV